MPVEVSSKITSPFEANKLINDVIGKGAEELAESNMNKIIREDIFHSLLESGEALDNDAQALINEIESLKINFKNEFDKNFTFKIIFNSVQLMINEYKSQTTLFTSYTQSYFTMYEEENLVKLLDILREILKERKTIINDVINNIIKIQKLTNDRIKIDMGSDDEDIQDLIDPDEIK